MNILIPNCHCESMPANGSRLCEGGAIEAEMFSQYTKFQ